MPLFYSLLIRYCSLYCARPPLVAVVGMQKADLVTVIIPQHLSIYMGTYCLRILHGDSPNTAQPKCDHLLDHFMMWKFSFASHLLGSSTNPYLTKGANSSEITVVFIYTWIDPTWHY